MTREWNPSNLGISQVDSSGARRRLMRQIGGAACAVSLVAVTGCSGGSTAPATTATKVPAQTRKAMTVPATSMPRSLDGRGKSLDRLRTVLGAKELSVSFADLGGGVPVTYGAFSKPYAWSSIKTVILATLLGEVGGPAHLSPEQKAAATRAITASDNDAAMSMFKTLEHAHGGISGAATAMERVLKQGGDPKTRVSTQGRGGFSPYGQTLWEPSGQATFMSALVRGCVMDKASTDYILGLMGAVQPDQRWGLGTVGSTAFKGGWGPDPTGGYLVRQIGLLTPRSGGASLAVSLDVRPADGSFESGSKQLSRVAEWARGNAPKAAAIKVCQGAKRSG